MTTGDAVDLIQEELGEEGHDGPPRNKPLPAEFDLVGKKDSVETQVSGDLERLRSDATTHGSQWTYTSPLGDGPYRGHFEEDPFSDDAHMVLCTGGSYYPSKSLSEWEALLASGHLQLVSPPSVVAPEPSDVQEEPLPSVQPLSRRDSIATQIYIAKMTNGVSYKIRFEDAVEEADLLIAQLDKEVV